MATRGPKRGWKKPQAAAAAPAVAAAAPKRAKPAPKKLDADAAVSDPAQAAPLSAAHRENPAKLAGDALRRLGHRRGLSMSAMASMSDEKIREQLKYVVYRQYETEGA